MAYEDAANSNKATVMKYDSSSSEWVTAGTAGFSSSAAYSESLAFSPDGTPYVAYVDTWNDSYATLMKLGPETTATTGEASDLTSTTVTLNGTVNDGGASTTVTFQYGTTTSYGSSVAATTPTGGTIAAGTGSTAVSVGLTGLSPVTTYHFRVTATSTTTVYGGDEKFTTAQATPSVTTWPTASSIIYGQTLASSTLSGGVASVDGSFSWTTSSTAPSAGTSSQSVTFTPSDTTDYNTVAGTVSVTTNKATPTISSWPTASSITYGQTLASSTLSGGSGSVSGSFAWTTSSMAPSAGTSSQSVTFTPSDTTDYTTVTGTVSVTTVQATPTFTTWPTASSIIYGQTLASSTLSGGSASVAGSFAWVTASTAPAVGTAS